MSFVMTTAVVWENWQLRLITNILLSWISTTECQMNEYVHSTKEKRFGWCFSPLHALNTIPNCRVGAIQGVREEKHFHSCEMHLSLMKPHTCAQNRYLIWSVVIESPKFNNTAAFVTLVTGWGSRVIESKNGGLLIYVLFGSQEHISPVGAERAFHCGVPFYTNAPLIS
jgi:hypothetical protein